MLNRMLKNHNFLTFEILKLTLVSHALSFSSFFSDLETKDRLSTIVFLNFCSNLKKNYSTLYRLNESFCIWNNKIIIWFYEWDPQDFQLSSTIMFRGPEEEVIKGLVVNCFTWTRLKMKFLYSSASADYHMLKSNDLLS